MSAFCCRPRLLWLPFVCTGSQSSAHPRPLFKRDLQTGSDAATGGWKQPEEKPGQARLESRQGWQEAPQEAAQFKTGSGQQLQRLFPAHQRPPSQADAAVPMLDMMVDPRRLALGLPRAQLFGLILQDRKQAGKAFPA